MSETNPIVVMKTSEGVLRIELFAKEAATSVANFLEYVKKDFYDNLIFHRVNDGFMIQGGGFDKDMKQTVSGTPIANEANNGLKNTVGTLAMARTNDPHSATSQFFINVSDNEFLNHSSPTPQGWGYAVFGKVIAGLEVLDVIKKVKTGSKGFHQDVPVNPVIIHSVTIEAPEA